MKQCRSNFASPSILTIVFWTLIVLSCARLPVGAQTTYYVDATNGSDAKIGTSSSLAWKTIARVNSQAFVRGDSILFKRGGTWREALGVTAAGNPTTWSGTRGAHIVFGAYGSGAKPKLLGGLDKSSTSDWTRDAGNVWKTVAKFPSDVGNLVFNNEASAGWKRWSKDRLGSQGDFCFNRTDSLVYLYSTSNPGSYYTHIEMVLKALRRDAPWAAHIITVYRDSCLTFENLDLRYGGWIGIHCYGGPNVPPTDILVQNCDFSWIGGSYGVDSIRAGNAWQTFNGGIDLSVRYCTFNQIYDTPMDVEGIGAGVYRRIFLYYNSLSNAHYGFEFHPKGSLSNCTIDSVRIENNTTYSVGNEWSYGQRYNASDTHSSACVQLWGLDSATVQGDVYIRNNIFCQSKDWLLFENAWPAKDLAKLHLTNNCYYTTSSNTIVVWDRASWTGYGWAGQQANYTNSQFATYQGATGKDANSIMANPLFTSPKDFHLQNNSPCRNAGLRVGLMRDVEGSPVNDPPDIGAFKVSITTSTPSGQREGFPRDYSLYQNYPNPFNPKTTIRYEVPQKTFVTIEVYDIVGRLVRALVNEEKEGGSYLVALDAGTLASSVYYYRMQAGSFVATRPCILLK